MAESKIYKLSEELTIEMVAEKLRLFLSDQKKLNAESVQTNEGYLVQAKAAESWKKFAGMDSAIQIQMSITGNNLLTVNIGSGQWIDKAGAAAVGALIFWPLLATSAIGAWGQKKLPEEIINFLDKTIQSHNGSQVFTAEPNSNTIICPNCQISNHQDNRFCESCGTKFETTCPHCLAVIPLGQDSCPACGKSLMEKPIGLTCITCNTPLTEGQQFCPDCGSSVILEKPMLTCPQCHIEIKEGQKFCFECGTPTTAIPAEPDFQ